MDPSLLAILFCIGIGAVLLGVIAINPGRLRDFESEGWRYFERCPIKFTYAGIIRFGMSSPGTIGVNASGVVIKLMSTTEIPFSEIRSVFCQRSLFGSHYTQIDFGMPGQNVRIYSKQPEAVQQHIVDGFER